MLVLLAMLLQAAPPERQTLDLPVSVERIRRKLAREDPILTAPPPAVPVFRIRVTERRIPSDLLWQQDRVAPSYVRPQQPLYHYEFVAKTTPEASRSATLYPCCVPVLPAVRAVQRAVRRAARSYAQDRAQRAVEKDLERFKAAQREQPQ
jgi:hypothetical protein